MFRLYVLSRNVAVEWPFGYRFGLAPVKARDENLPTEFCISFSYDSGTNIRFSEAAVSRKRVAADALSALYASVAQLVGGNRFKT